MKNIKKVIFTLTLAVFLLLPLKSVLAQSAVETECDSAPYSALIQLPVGNYNLYVQAGRVEDNGTVRVYFQDLEASDCRLVGQGEISNSSYKKLGVFNLTNTASLGSLYIIGDKKLEATNAGASSPLVIFSDTSTQPCNPEIGCKVNYNDDEFMLSPKKISLSSDSLKVGLLTPFSTAFKEVIYSVDGHPVYTKPILEEFNRNYVSDGEHTISRTIVLSDGQSLSDSRIIKRGLEGGFTYFFISVLYGQSALVRLILLIIALCIILGFVFWVVRKIRYKKRWYKSHFASTEQVDMSKAGFKTNFSNEESIKDLLLKYRKLLIIVFVVIAGLFFVNSFVLSYFTVDGVSMYPTLQDRSKRLLLVLPVSIGKLNHNYYTPQRGAIVVIQKDDNNLFMESAEKEKHYVVKRVIGLPGERVVVRDGKIIVYNKQNIKGFEPDVEFNWVKDLAGSEGMALDITLKDGELFVVGDNRDESIDSRMYGPIKTGDVIGKVL